MKLDDNTYASVNLFRVYYCHFVSYLLTKLRFTKLLPVIPPVCSSATVASIDYNDTDCHN